MGLTYSLLGGAAQAGSGAVDSVNGQTGTVVLDTSDITDTADKRYVTDAELTVLGTTSGTNTGDQDLSGLVPNTRTVAGHALSANVTLAKGDVGLGNVDNTADTAKPVSTAQQTALDGKVTADGITTITTITQAAYDALGTPDANTLYVIVG